MTPLPERPDSGEPGEGEVAPSPPQVFVRLQPPGWPRPRGYSNGIVVPPGHALVLTGGVIGWDETETLVSGGFAAQFEQALRNVLAVCAEAGAGPEHVVRMTCYVTDREQYLADLPGLGTAWRRTMGRSYPTMALVQVAGLVEPGALVEIEATAAVPQATGPRA